MPKTRFAFVLLAFGVLTRPAWADWQPVATGIEYQEFTVAGPNNVYVARMDRANTSCLIDSLIGGGTLTGATETVSGQAARYDDALGYWGQVWGPRQDIVVAINGDFYSAGVPVGGQIQSGWYAKRHSDYAGGSGFAWQLDRDAFIGQCVHHVANKQKVTYVATGQTQNITNTNTPRGANELIVYTHHGALTTGTDNSGSEVVVRLSRPLLVIPSPNGVTGTVVEIRPGLGATTIGFDEVVLSAHGTAETKLLANVSIGAEVKISQEITHYLHDCSTSLALDWTKTYASIGGSFHFLMGGVIQPSSDPGATARHPRTAIAFNDTYIFFIVVDGRSGVSVGMSMTELGTFCLDYLSAAEGLNQDGGGSSAMWVNGQIMNVPSDGTERPVANGMCMALVQPLELSTRFLPGAAVRAGAAVSVRVGPGISYGVSGSAASGAQGTVTAHNLAGVRASNQYWWPCQFDSASGWVPETALLPSGCAGDFNGDGQIDPGDLGGLQFCLAGPGVTYAAGHFCRAGDADSDGDVDLADVGAMQTCVEE